MRDTTRPLCAVLWSAIAGVLTAGHVTAGSAVAAPPVPSEDGVAWDKQILTSDYLSDGINAGDFNQDGHPDIVAGPRIYAGPDFSTWRDFYPAHVFPTKPSPTDSMFSFVHDFNRDGWPDILVLGRVHLHAAYWYENPQNDDGRWKKHFVFERVRGESPTLIDIDADGRPELVSHWDDRWGLIQPDPTDPTRPWTFQPITDQRPWGQFYHGTGVGDVDRDGRLDLILNDGWWEQPADPQESWTEHPYRFADRGGAQMFVYDVDGDGLNDVVTALDAHGYGLAWFEQLPEDGNAPFKKHMMMDDRAAEAEYGVCFSQPHALAMSDIDGDGLQDIVVGKRMWAHPPPKDVEPNAPPVLYWFRLNRNDDGQARFVPHLIDDASGVGVQVVIADVDADRRPDVLTVSKLGAFVFFNRASATP